jgi:hypothetical protein
MPRDRRIIDVEERKPGFDLNNIDMSQIMGLMQNIDFNQLSSMVSALGGVGGIGNILGGLSGGSGGIGSILSGLSGGGGIGSILGALSGAGATSEDNKHDRNRNREKTHYSGDRQLDVLYALKPLVTPERANLIDMILQLYIISRILRR